MKIPPIVIVTGTDTGVGKTMTTAALAAALMTRGRTVAVYKPTQTGAVDGDSDITEVRRLTGLVTAEAGVVLGEPLAPRPAARLDAVVLPSMAQHAQRVTELATAHDHVLVEGAGGLLVELDEAGATLADLARLLGSDHHRPQVVLVARAGLGTLNHTALTLEALERRGAEALGIVVGSVPREPGLAERGNLESFASGPVPLLGAIPEGAALLPPELFRREAPTWFERLMPV